MKQASRVKCKRVYFPALDLFILGSVGSLTYLRHYQQLVEGSPLTHRALSLQVRPCVPVLRLCKSLIRSGCAQANA